MKDNMLRTIIRHFDDVVKDVDFENLSQRESKEYRELLKKTANDKIFFDGRYSETTEWTLEIFDREDVRQAVADLRQFNALTEAERQRLRFYLDLKDMCYPLFKGDKVDWQAWPWNMKNGDASMHNKEFFDFITDLEYKNVAAAIVYDLTQQVWKSPDIYTSVARNEVSQNYSYDIKPKWRRDYIKEMKEGELSLGEQVYFFCDKLWGIENHILVGKELGFDFMAQSIYDAIDGSVNPYFDYAQIMIARELSQWFSKNWTIGDVNPTKEKLKELYHTFRALNEKYDLRPIDFGYTWDILTLDVLGLPITDKSDFYEWESEYDADDDDWKDD